MKLKILKALANEKRLKIVQHLYDANEAKVNDIVNHINAPQPIISQSLDILRRAGIVESRRDGLCVIYKLKYRSEIARILRALTDYADTNDVL